MQQRIIKENELDYLSRVFKGLTVEKQDNILNSARQLLKVQENDTFSLFVNKTVTQRKK